MDYKEDNLSVHSGCSSEEGPTGEISSNTSTAESRGEESASIDYKGSQKVRASKRLVILILLITTCVGAYFTYKLVKEVGRKNLEKQVRYGRILSSGLARILSNI